MDTRTPEPGRARSHGLVNAAPLVAPLAIASLVAGVTGGLARLGLVEASPSWIGQAAVAHAALMICGFFGTVIGIERAVAVRLRWAWLAPFASALGAVALLAGAYGAGGGLIACAAAVFTLVNLVVVRRQSSPHTWLLLAAAIAWLAGSVLRATSTAGDAVVAWWFAFLVITIAAERLELTRLMPRRPRAQLALYGIVALLVAGCAAGSTLFGAALLALGGWLALFDIARRTVLTQGLSRYMAVCLLSGYGWLAVSGLAWMLTGYGVAARDLALHGLGLGFVFSMVMGHAPVIFPAVSRRKVAYSALFYVPLAVLHASLLLRVAVSQQLGAALNAAALVLFVLTLAAAVRRASVQGRRTPEATSRAGPESPRR